MKRKIADKSTMDTKKLIIGTRGSKLALWQATHVQARLRQTQPDLHTEIKTILTSGDWKPADGEKPLSHQDGGKAQFAKEIEESLLKSEIDIAVHSMKDMDSHLPDGLTIPFTLPREEANDAFLFADRANTLPKNPKDWPADTTIGTTSTRRKAALLALNPSLNILPLRGNVETRISKLRGDLAEDYAKSHAKLDVTILALAGLKRLELTQEIDQIITPDIMIPAASQGAIGIEIRESRLSELSPLITPIACPRAHIRITAERAALKTINGSCHTPIGLHAHFTQGNALTLQAQIHSPCGTLSHAERATATVITTNQAADLGHTLGQAILSNASLELLKAAL